MAVPPAPRGSTLAALWWRRGSVCSLWLAPLAMLYGWAWRLHAWSFRSGWRRQQRVGVAVIVVGNLVVGGAGKTPAAMAIVALLRERGWCPGVVSRGYARRGEGILEVRHDSAAAQVGDEALLMHRRTHVPVFVGADRVAAANALRQRHPHVDVIVCDDGLQHLRLARDVEVVVLDARGVGNARLLPAGPLRQPMPASPPPGWLVVHNADAPVLDWPGHLAERRLAGAVELGRWWAGDAPDPAALRSLQGRRVIAAAGLAEPERFFAMLEREGLQIERIALADHDAWHTLPWPDGTAEALVTEKDAVKLAPERAGGTRVWVVALDFRLDAAFADALTARLAARKDTRWTTA